MKEEFKKMIKINDNMIDFSLPNEKGELITLSSFKGKKIILYFYPKDMTSGCTKEALGYKEDYLKFKELNAVVIGISKDSIESHKKFISKNELPFILLSDESLEVIKAYDAYGEKSLYGKKYMGVIRSTVIIDENGKIIYINKKANASSDSKDSLCVIGK